MVLSISRARLFQPRAMAWLGLKMVKNRLKKSNNNSSFKCKLAKVLFYYRSTTHSVTKIPPCINLNGRKLILLKDKIHPVYSSSEIKNNDKPK